ncbi:MAG TPA: hypothetical protein VGI75_07050 [Pirellulales bacterium]|jgi:hypothetical protein
MKLNVALFAAMVASILGAAGIARAQQPFQNIQQAPTVSPYLNLVNNNNSSRSGAFPAYQTLVEPFLQQQQQQQQINQLQKTTQQLTTGGLTQPARGASNTIRGTGHVTATMDYLHYYTRPQTHPAPNGG